MAGLQSVQIKETKYPETIVTIKCNILHSDFQNGSPQLSLFHRTFQIAAGVGAAKMWKDTDFGTRSYSTRIQGSTPKDKNYRWDLLRQGLVPLCFYQQRRATDLISYTLRWTTTGVCFLFLSGLPTGTGEWQGTASERLQPWIKEFLAGNPKAAAGTDLENTVLVIHRVGMWRQDTWQCPLVSKTPLKQKC